MQFASWASEKAAAESLKVAGKSKIMQKNVFHSESKILQCRNADMKIFSCNF